jgi:hypothetical protein
LPWEPLIFTQILCSKCCVQFTVLDIWKIHKSVSSVCNVPIAECIKIYICFSLQYFQFLFNLISCESDKQLFLLVTVELIYWFISL